MRYNYEKVKFQELSAAGKISKKECQKGHILIIFNLCVILIKKSGWQRVGDPPLTNSSSAHACEVIFMRTMLRQAFV